MWGVASSAYQVEGATGTDGRGPSIWDDFRRRKPSRFRDRASADVACDHYARLDDDLDLIAALGVDAYRFSIAWPRILPAGTGTPNRRGVEFYDRLIDGLLARGVTPFATVYHWDLPQALEARGGFVNRDVVHWLTDYAEWCARLFGDRVRHFAVLNEALTFTAAGYWLGAHAPGRHFLRNFLPAAHHALLAQGAAARAIKAVCPRAEVGTVVAMTEPRAHRDHPDDHAAAERVRSLCHTFLEPVLGGTYPVERLPLLQRIERFIRPGDLEQIAFPIDFVGINHYFSLAVTRSRLVPYLGLRPVPQPHLDRTDLGWEIDPDAFESLLVRMGRDPRIPKVYVTENGAAFDDVVDASGGVRDPRRVAYFEAYFKALERARARGAAVAGYFAWSLFDSFEWTGGYRDRFGLYHVDHATHRRTLKDSGRYYRDHIARTRDAVAPAESGERAIGSTTPTPGLAASVRGG